MEMFVILTCLILSHGITRTEGAPESDKTSAKESKKGESGEAPKPAKGAEKATPGENKQNKNLPESKNEKPLGKDAKEAKGEGHEPAEKKLEAKPGEKKQEAKPGENKQDKPQSHAEDKKTPAEKGEKGKPESHEPSKGKPDKDNKSKTEEKKTPGKEAEKGKPEEHKPDAKAENAKSPKNEPNTDKKDSATEKHEAGKSGDKEPGKSGDKEPGKSGDKEPEKAGETAEKTKPDEDEREKAAAEAMKKLGKQEEAPKTEEPNKGKMAQDMIFAEKADNKPQNQNQSNPDVENMIREEQARVRGEELEQTEDAQNPDQVNQKKAHVNPEATKLSPEEEAKKAEAAKGNKTDQGKKAEEAKPDPIAEQNNADAEQMILEQSGRERAKELEETEQSQEKNPEKTPDFAEMEKKVAKDMDKGNSDKPKKGKEEDKKSKPGEKGKAGDESKEEEMSSEDEEEEPGPGKPKKGKKNKKLKKGKRKHGKAGDESKKEKTSSDDMEKGKPDKPKPGKEEDKKSKPGKGEHGKAGDDSNKEKMSPKDKEKGNPDKSKPGKEEDKKSKPGQGEPGKAGDDSKKEKKSPKDMEKGNYETYELLKGDRDTKRGAFGRYRAEDESEFDDTLWDETERAKRQKLEPAEEAKNTAPDQITQKTTEGDSETKKLSSENITTTTPKKVERTGAGEAANVPITAVDDQTLLRESKSVSECIMNDLPEELREKMEETDDAEERVLTSYVTAENIPYKVIHGYTVAKEAERRFLKDLLPELGSEADNVLAAYRALRKGEAWNYVKLDGRFKAFFKQPSSSLTQYQTLKADEKSSLDSFLNSASQIQTVNGTQAQTVNVTKRSFAVDGSTKLERSEDVLQRGVADVGVEAKERSNATERGNGGNGGSGGNDTTDEDFENPEDDFDESASEEATRKSAGMHINYYKSSLVKSVILCSLIAELLVIFLIVIVCRKQIAKWSLKHKRPDPGKDAEPANGYSPIEDHETEAAEKSAHFSISVTTVERTDHP